MQPGLWAVGSCPCAWQFLMWHEWWIAGFQYGGLCLNTEGAQTSDPAMSEWISWHGHFSGMWTLAHSLPFLSFVSHITLVKGYNAYLIVFLSGLNKGSSPGTSSCWKPGKCLHQHFRECSFPLHHPNKTGLLKCESLPLSRESWRVRPLEGKWVHWGLCWGGEADGC